MTQNSCRADRAHSGTADAEGGSALDPEVVAQLLARSRSRWARSPRASGRCWRSWPRAGPNSAIAAALVAGAGAAEKHINNIFTQLGLAPGDTGNRRVVAVLRYLETG